jgi:type IV secretory pathway VirJ component
MSLGRTILRGKIRLTSILPAAALLAASSTRAAAQARPGVVDDVHDLPLIEVPSTTGNTLAVFLSGDGGWADLDQQVSAALAARGIAVVGLNTRSYLHSKRTPNEAARDVSRLVTHYMASWKRNRVAIIGYSRGADIAPFVASRLPAEQRARLSLVAMLGLAPFAGFQFHWGDMLHTVRRPGDPLTLPELERLRGVPMLCVYGLEEKESGCRDAPDSLIKRYARGGAHHFDGDYRALAEIIIAALPR